MERSVDREPLSRIAIGAVVASAGGVSYALATAQETSYAWMSTGHSPVVWLVLAVVATHLGTFRQALFVVPAVLVVSVIVYYAVLADHGRAVAEVVDLVAFWGIGGIVGGVGLALVADWALDTRDSYRPWVARGVVVGLIIGATMNSAFDEQLPFTSQAWAAFRYEVAEMPWYLVIGATAAISYVAYIGIRCRPPVSVKTIAFPGGVVLGWILALLPGLLLDVVRGI